MNESRKQYLKEKVERDKELFEKIKDIPSPSIDDLWSLSETYFIKWRQQHDFPRLLNHFDSTLKLFKEWKQDNKLSNELIIATGKITPFLEHKKLSKEKNMFLIEQTFDGKKRTFVSYGKLEGDKINSGVTYNYKVLQEFYSYMDWLKDRQKSENILYINSRHAPNSDIEKVFIHADVYASSSEFELLKMGGIEVPVNGFGILLRGKYLEFVNLCGLKLSGRISFGSEGNLNCSYCACDNMVATDLDMPLLRFEHCSITNLKIITSKIHSWRFYDCIVNGDFENSQFDNINIWGGVFSPIMKGCTIFDFNIRKEKVLDDKNLYAYQLLKKTYADQGNDEKAIEYFIKEHEFKRKRSSGWQFISKSISSVYWGYGRKPQRIIWISLFSIIIFAFIYWFNKELITLNNGNPELLSFFDCFYFSTTTFTTLGYGDYSPNGLIRVAATFQALFGVLNIGFLVSGFATNKY